MFSRLAGVNLCLLTDVCSEQDVHIQATHTVGAGGATAVANAGVPDILFKRHGRWKLESAKDGCVKDSVESLLEVSKNLGI